MTSRIDDMFRDGFARLSLSPRATELLAETLCSAHGYFQLDEDEKQRDFFPGQHLGFRSGGIEFSATPERPDLNDSLNLSAGWRHVVHESSPAMPFCIVAEQLREVLDALAQEVLRDVAQRYPGENTVPETVEHSWLQVNYYRRFPQMRDVLQDKHEDAHLLTLWHSRKPGLEIFTSPRDEPTSITVGESSVLIMPGSLLTMLTGGDVPPLFHRVIQVPEVENRMALMYFVNPNINKPLYAYKRDPDSDTQDIAAVGARNPELFGLPKLK